MTEIDVRTTDVELGVLVQPGTAGPHPGVVMVPDVRGVSDHFRGLARRLAAEGFAVLVVDLYRRSGPPQIPDVAAALAWMRDLSDPRVLADCQAAITDLADGPAVAGRPVGITGFCMGGQYAILAACRCEGLSACVAFYGMLVHPDDADPEKKPVAPLDALPGLTCPLLGLYGEEDPLIPLSQVDELEWRLADTGRPGAVHRYPGAGHAFVNDTQPQRYRPEAARDAWGRMVAFFREHLTRSAAA
jgi:carboxymethylenebutenolidase